MLIGQRRMGVDLLLADSVSAISVDLTTIYARLKRSASAACNGSRADALQNRSTSYGGISRVQFPASLPFPKYP